jgi:hypothetical protein
MRPMIDGQIRDRGPIDPVDLPTSVNEGDHDFEQRPNSVVE